MSVSPSSGSLKLNLNCIKMAASEDRSLMDDLNSSLFLVPGFGPSRKKRQENWTTESTFALVDVWRDNIGALRSLKRNGHIYQKIAHQLHLAGYRRATFEVKTKIGNLTNEYRRERKRLQAEGGSSRFKFWDVIHEMMTADITTSDGSTSREGFEDDEDSAFSVGDELVFPSSMNPVSITSEWSPIDEQDDDIEINHEVPDEDEEEDDEEKEQEHENCELEGSVTSLRNSYSVKIKQEVPDEVETTQQQQEEEEESRVVGETSFVSEQRRNCSQPPPPSSQRAKCRKRKFRTEDERLKIMNMMYEENKRMNAATQRTEKEILALMREQTDLQRQSMIVEERIARAIENACRALTSSSPSSPLRRQCNGAANGLSSS